MQKASQVKIAAVCHPQRLLRRNVSGWSDYRHRHHGGKDVLQSDTIAVLFHFSYQRYLENQIRETFGLTGTPIRMITREHGDGSAKAGKV